MTLNKADQQVGGSWSREDHTPSPPSPTPSPRERIEWQCGNFPCQSRTFARADEQYVEGFRPGPFVRCVECKAVSYWPEVLSAFPEVGEVERLKLCLDTVELTLDMARVNHKRELEAAERARDEALSLGDVAEIQRDEAEAKIKALSALLTQAGEALEPFGRAADRVNDKIAFATNIWPESDLTKWFTGTKALFNRADFWRVREALSLIKKESGDV